MLTSLESTPSAPPSPPSVKAAPSRERLWRDFGADPEWQNLRARPGLSDAEIVSNISNAILRPLAFSAIR